MSEDRVSLRKGRNKFEAVLEKYSIKGDSFQSRMLNLAEYLLTERSIQVFEECACEGCYWYDGWDSKRSIPICANPKPLIDKKFLNATIGKICKQAQEDQMQIAKALGNKMSWKKIQKSKELPLAVAVHKKIHSLETELDYVRNQQIPFIDNELQRLTSEVANGEELKVKLDEANKNLEDARKREEELLNVRSILESRVSEVQNALLERDEIIDNLNKNIDVLNRQIEELSHDRLFEENQLLKVQLAQANKIKDDYKLEIQKEVALREKEHQQKVNVIEQVTKMIKEFKLFMPSTLKDCELCVASFQIKDYLNSIQKKIEQLEGYLNTVYASE